MHNIETSNPRVLRRPEVLRLTGLSRSTQWRAERAGKFPKRFELTGGSVGWLESEILNWINDRANQRGETVNV